MLTIFKFKLPGITCVNCVEPVERALSECTSLHIVSYSTDVFCKIIYITIDHSEISKQQVSTLLRETIESVGVDCVEIPDDALISIAEISQVNDEMKRRVRYHLTQGTLGLLSGVAFMSIMLTEISISIITMYILMAMSSVLTLILGAESYFETFKKLIKSRTLTMDTLFTISTSFVIGESFASFYIPELKMRMEAGLFIFGFRHIGQAVEESIKQRVISGMSFKDRANAMVKIRVERDNYPSWEMCHALSIKPGSVIRVEKNGIIPIDGACESEQVTLYKTILTGVITPSLILKGEPILAGMKVPEDVDFIDIRVTKPVSQSYLARLDEKIAQANVEKAPIETTMNRILQYFIITVILFTLVSSLAIYFAFKKSRDLTLEFATSLLVSACPCILGLIIALAVKIGMTKALENGVKYKNSKALQAGNHIDIIVCDLFGTLTQGIYNIIDCELYPNSNHSIDDFLFYLAAIESKSHHPIAKAIFNYAQTQLSVNPSADVQQVDLTRHNGIKATVNGEICLVGNSDFLEFHQVDLSDIQQDNEALHTIYLVKSGRLIGNIKIDDPLRMDALFTIKQLKKMGKTIYIATGTDQKTALRVAKALNIPNENVFANCLGAADDPNAHTKTRIIEHLKKNNKRVAMVGDNANDALALANSDFGIAIKSQSGDIDTQDQADAVLDNSSLVSLITTFAVANQTVRSIKQNLILNLVYNVTMALIEEISVIFFGVAVHPSIGVGVMILQMSLMLLNQNRIKNQTLPHLKELAEENKHGNQSDLNTDATYPRLGPWSIHRWHARVRTNLSEKSPLLINNDSENIGYSQRPITQ